MLRLISIFTYIFYSFIGTIKFKKIINCYGFFSCGNYKNIRIGKNVTINGNVYIQAREKVIIGDNVTLSRNVSVFDAGLDNLNKRKHICKPVILNDDVWIGAGSIILPGVELGRNIIVGAGSVVTKSFESNTIIAGNPAKIIGRIRN